MAYSPTEWKTGDVISAEKLNKLENGVAGGGGGGSSGLFPITLTWNADWSTASLNKTFAEIKTAIESGLFPYVTSISDASEYALSIYALQQIYGSDSEGWTAVLTVIDESGGQDNIYSFTGVSLSSYPYYNA